MTHSLAERFILVVLLSLFVGCQASIEYELESGDKDRREDSRGELKDIISEAVLPAFTPSKTRYADGYTEEAFNALPIGVSQDQAELALGPPLLRRTCGDEKSCWHYSEAAGEPENYFVRVLVFDREGVLLDKHRSFYVD